MHLRKPIGFGIDSSMQRDRFGDPRRKVGCKGAAMKVREQCSDRAGIRLRRQQEVCDVIQACRSAVPQAQLGGPLEQPHRIQIRGNLDPTAFDQHPVVPFRSCRLERVDGV